MKNSTHKGMEFLGMGNRAWDMGKKLPMTAVAPFGETPRPTRGAAVAPGGNPHRPWRLPLGEDRAALPHCLPYALCPKRGRLSLSTHERMEFPAAFHEMVMAH